MKYTKTLLNAIIYFACTTGSLYASEDQQQQITHTISPIAVITLTTPQPASSTLSMTALGNLQNVQSPKHNLTENNNNQPKLPQIIMSRLDSTNNKSCNNACGKRIKKAVYNCICCPIFWCMTGDCICCPEQPSTGTTEYEAVPQE